MKRRRGAPPARAGAATRPRSPLIPLVGAFAVLLPLVLVPAEDPWRYPKELVLRFEAILAAAVILSGVVLGRAERSWREAAREPWAILTAAAVVWTAVTTLTSTNRLTSGQSLAYVAALAIVFAATMSAMRRGGFTLALVPLVAAALNTVVVFVEQARVWAPYPVVFKQWKITGMIGPSGDLGCYLMITALCAAAVALASARWRVPAGILAVFLTFGTFASSSITAVVALGVGLTVLAAMRSKWLVVVPLLIVVVVGLSAYATSWQVRIRWVRLVNAWTTGNVDQFFSYRFVAYRTAWMMAVDHPWTGVGPGAYGPRFLDYRDRLESLDSSAVNLANRQYDFTEAHNDHLQVLAQSGIPGYALFLAALVLVARASLRSEAQSDEGRFSRLLGLPLAAGFGVLALAQFPLELAAPTHTLLYYAAAVTAWKERP